MKKVNLENYRKDKYYPRIVSVVEDILSNGNIVKTIDVFVELGMLEKKKLKDWKEGRAPYLEKVLSGSLSKLSRILRILRFHVHDLNLKPQKQCIKNGKKVLRYSKYGDRNLEEAYSYEFVKLSKKM